MQLHLIRICMGNEKMEKEERMANPSKRGSSYTFGVRLNLRPLQINSLFPVHRPHLVTVSSIIFHYSVFFHYFPVIVAYCMTGSFETMSAHVSAVLSSLHKLHVYAIFATSKGRNKLKHTFMQLFMIGQAGKANNGLKSYQSYNE